MKTLEEFLSELRSLDIKIWLDAEQLRLKAPRENLTPTLLSQLQERKPEILAFLHQVHTKNRSQFSSLSPIPRTEHIPLSFSQTRLWFLNQLEPNSSAYNIPTAYRLTGHLSIKTLEQSLNEIVRRHESLRTCFVSTDVELKQVIYSNLDLTLPIIDLQELLPDEKRIKAQQIATSEAQQPFTLATGPLFRTQLLRLSDQEHILLLNFHHIISDGKSCDVFFQELTTLYKTFSTDKPSPLPELPIQYADFAHWQRECLQGEILESKLNYWKQLLAGSLPILQLPTNYPRPPVQTYPGAYQSLELSLHLTKALKTLSQQEGVTLFMTLLAAFQTLLYRYSGQEDIIVGTPIAGRNRIETEGLIGFFVNTLAIRTNLSGNPRFRQLLRQVREVTLGAYDHQDLPLERLIEELKPERDLSRSPLFQVMFVFQNTPRQPWELLGLTITPLEVHSGTSKFDLTLALRETSEGIKGGIEYNTDLFEATTITRMLGHFQTLLESIVTNPEQHLSDLPLLTAAEQHQLLIEWNNTQTDYPKNTSIHQLFEAQVERTPNAIAVVFENEQLTYQQLNHRANKLAHHLQKLGVKPEVTVGICVERSLEMLVALLAILKAGGAYIPLDPTYPQERRSFMLEDSQVSLLLTTSKIVQYSLSPSRTASSDKIDRNQQSPINPEQLTVIFLDKTWEIINQENSDNPKNNIDPTNLAYILYTSGSTGFPKGVAIEHRSTVNFINWAQTVFKPEQLAGVLASTSICFDLSVFELFVPLSCGGKVILAENALYLPTLKAAEDVTLINTVPSAIAELLRANALPQNVQTVNLAGEPLSQQLVNQLYEQTTLQQVFNLYGPSEATTYSTFTLCVPRRGENEKVYPSPSIGRPIANTEIYILDSHLQPVPIGVPGELYIGGDGLARSYLNRQNLTEEKFIPNSFLNSKFKIPNLKGDRLYKTGDLARYLPDGNIEFLGRIDNQVKIRGFRIELGEVESTLSQYPSVQQCVVTARVDCESDKYLVAYIVSNQQQKPTTDELRRFLKQKLPDYMVPSAFVFLDTLPLTPNGKIDQRALPAPDGLRQEPASTFVPPSDDLEIQLTKIWENVLGKKPISVKDNFFDVGGHSLLAVRLLAQIEKTFGKNLPLATLFQAPTVEQLAKILHQSGWSSPWFSLVPIQPSGSQPPFFGIHALGKGQEYYRNIARHLGSDQPVYGLDYWLATRTKDRKEAPNTWRVEELAAHYIKEMRILQPEGPYFLAGLSLAGIVAYEIAQQLVRQDQKVALLVLFDTSCPTLSVKSLDFNPLQIHLRNLSQLEMKEKLAYIMRKVKYKIQHYIRGIKPFFRKGAEKFYLKFKLPMPYALHYSLIVEANQKLANDYALQVYPGKVTLFRASDQPVRYDQISDLGWSALAVGGVEIHEVSGGHMGMFQEPHVQMLAEKLRACIDRVQADDLAYIPSLCSDPCVCDKEDSEG